MATTLAASAGALAGCNGGGNETDTPGDEDTPTPTEASGATDTEGDGTTAVTDTTASQGPPVDDTMQSYIPTVPEQSFLYEYGTSGSINNNGLGWVVELCLPFREGTTDFQTSGSTYDLGDMGEVEVACWIEDYEIEAPYDWWETYDDRTTYWDGTNMDANAYENDLRLYYYGEGLGRFSPGDTTWEVVDDWEMHQWRRQGDGENVPDNATNQFNIELNDIGRYHPPPHPDFTTQWADDLENASTEDEADSLWTNLQSEAVTFFDFAENGWGSGLYEIPSVDDVSNEAMSLQAREDHPNYRDQTIDNIELQVADASRQSVLLNQGEVDLDQNVISEETGSVNRGTLPDHIQQLSTTGSNAIFGCPFNWEGDLGNLWVRRAVVAAVDWIQVGENAYGPDAFFGLEYLTGTSDTIAESWMPSEFLDSLHDWPMEADTELATEYMERAGYSRQGGTWVRPNGEEVSLLGKAAPDYGQFYSVSVQSIQQMLNDFGLPTEYENLSNQAYNQSRVNMTYDFVYHWNNQRSPFEAYTAASEEFNPKIVERDPDYPNSFDGTDDALGGRVPDLEPVENADGEVQEADTEDLRGQPLTAEIPTEVGNIEAPDGAGVEPDLSGNGIDSKEINLMEHLLELNTNPELSEDRLDQLLQDLAWYHNYYNPDFWAHQKTTGLIGNVRDFNWAPRGSAMLNNSARSGSTMMFYQSQSGNVYEKYNEEFESP